MQLLGRPTAQAHAARIALYLNGSLSRRLYWTIFIRSRVNRPLVYVPKPRLRTYPYTARRNSIF